MPAYKYKVMDKTGKKIDGVYNANNKNEVLQMIKTNNYYLLSIEDAIERENQSLGYYLNKVKTKDIAIFCRQFHTMLNAGLNILGCIDVLRVQSQSIKLRGCLNEVCEDIQKAMTFSDSLRKHKDVFPELLINMVESGELSGNLDIIMDRMAVHYEKEYKINSKIKSAMVYPIVLSVASIGIIVFLLTFVMPTFVGMFQSSGVKLPAPTRILLNMSSGLKKYWYLLLAFIIAVVYSIKLYKKTPNGRMFFDRLKFKVPIFKSTNAMIIVSRFTRTLSTLLVSGITLVEALQIVSSVVGNKVAERKIIEVREKTIKGMGLYDPLIKAEIFPPMLCSMVKIGEDSGTLDEILNKTADFYDDELETSLQRLTTLMEPLMIMVMGVMVGFIVIAMMMPMFDMFKTIQ